MFIVVLFLTVVFFFLKDVIATSHLREQLLTKGHYTIAKVVSIQYHPRKNYTWPVYTYTVNSKQYTFSRNSIIQKTSENYFDQWATGKSFYVLYLPGDPGKHSLLPLFNVSDSLIINKSNKRVETLVICVNSCPSVAIQ